MYTQNTIRMPREDFSGFQKVLVSLRKFQFQNYIYHRFTDEKMRAKLVIINKHLTMAKRQGQVFVLNQISNEGIS